MIIFAVLYWRDAFIHVAAEMLKITFTFSMLSCDWRDDQIRILQGNSDVNHGLPSRISPVNSSAIQTTRT
jgi:hypothetical protein